MKIDSYLSIPNISQIDWEWCVVINMYILDWENKWTNRQTNKKYLQMLLFPYMSEPINLSGFMINLLKYFHQLIEIDGRKSGHSGLRQEWPGGLLLASVA